MRLLNNAWVIQIGANSRKGLLNHFFEGWCSLWACLCWEKKWLYCWHPADNRSSAKILLHCHLQSRRWGALWQGEVGAGWFSCSLPPQAISHSVGTGRKSLRGFLSRPTQVFCLCILQLLSTLAALSAHCSFWLHAFQWWPLRLWFWFIFKGTFSFSSLIRWSLGSPSVWSCSPFPFPFFF